MKIPSEQEIHEFHKTEAKGKHADLVLDLVWTHCLIVKEIAQLIMDDLEKREHVVLDKDLVIAGCLLHDIGVYECLQNYPVKGNPPYIQHGIIGAKIIKSLGLEEKLARFASHHTGVGVTIEDIKKQNLPLPEKDFVPITAEEEIVAYADNFHGKDPAFCTFEEAKAEFAKFNPINGEVMDVWSRKYGIPDLNKLQEKYASWHKKFLELKSSLNNGS